MVSALKRKGVKHGKTARPQRKEFANWSARPTQRRNALDLDSGLLKKRSARQVAPSLEKSAEVGKRRKAGAVRPRL